MNFPRTRQARPCDTGMLTAAQHGRQMDVYTSTLGRTTVRMTPTHVAYGEGPNRTPANR
jgi:hypothetical protein